MGTIFLHTEYKKFSNIHEQIIISLKITNMRRWSEEFWKSWKKKPQKTDDWDNIDALLLYEISRSFPFLNYHPLSYYMYIRLYPFESRSRFSIIDKVVMELTEYIYDLYIPSYTVRNSHKYAQQYSKGGNCNA